MVDVRTTKSRITEYLVGKGWVSGMMLEDMAADWQTKSSTISRRARELFDEGRISRMITVRRTPSGKRVQTVQYASLGTFESVDQANNFIKSLEGVQHV